MADNQFLSPPPLNNPIADSSSGLGVNRNWQMWFSGVLNAIRGLQQPITFIQLQPSTAPANPAEGMIYYDSSAHSLMFYNGTEWLTFEVSGSG
jgi:hypothetical protein